MSCLPSSDASADKPKKFPHFCLLQMFISDDPSARHQKLQCIAYFRKQEMRYWWPVNVAEIAALRDEVYKSVARTHKGLIPGGITTVAAMAYSSSSCPTVAVPFVDRLLDEAPDLLWKLGFSLVGASTKDEPRIRGIWNKVLDDLVPAAGPDADPDTVPIAIEGLRYLSTEIARYNSLGVHLGLQEIQRHMASLVELNRRYLDSTRSATRTVTYSDWQKACGDTATELRKSLNKVWKRQDQKALSRRRGTGRDAESSRTVLGKRRQSRPRKKK